MRHYEVVFIVLALFHAAAVRAFYKVGCAVCRVYPFIVHAGFGSRADAAAWRVAVFFNAEFIYAAC